MNGYVIILLLGNSVALFLLPRRWAPIPFLIVALYIARDQVVQLGPFHFSVIRILISAGFLRMFVRGERLEGRINGMDKLILVWSLWMVISSIFHENQSSALVYRMGLVYDACGVYFLLRIFCQSIEDVVGLCRFTAILLLPVAIEMIYEKRTNVDLFYLLSGSSVDLTIREGHTRAQGPFGHAILAGTIGAVCLPMIVPLWRNYRKTAIIGIGACLAIIITSTSSGPIMSTMAAFAALYMWRFKNLMPFVRWFLLAGYILLDLVMKDPAYFIMARIDFVGGSTGYFRARLIQSAFEHLTEWWLAGTDYTRSWMPTGVTWSKDNTDITNYYLFMGVIGGLPLMLLFMSLLAKGFSFVGQASDKLSESSPSVQSEYLCWALGASLFAHTITFISVSYFDQSFVFIYLTLAAISSVWSVSNALNRHRENGSHISEESILTASSR